MLELKNCPFCGKRPHINMAFKTIECLNVYCPCMPSTGRYDSALEALDAWNTRLTASEKQGDENEGRNAKKKRADYGKIDMDVIPRSDPADRRQDLRNNGGTHLICFATRKNVR